MNRKKDCYIDKFGKPCERCLDIVVGLGDLRKITYENSCWHPEVKISIYDPSLKCFSVLHALNAYVS